MAEKKESPIPLGKPRSSTADLWACCYGYHENTMGVNANGCRSVLWDQFFNSVGS